MWLWLWLWLSVARAAQQAEADWNVGQIERQMSHQIELHARLGPEGCRLHACGRLPDWVFPQIGQIGFSARLPDWGFRQIGAFFSPNPCQTFAQAGRQIGFNARLPSTCVFPFEGFLQIDQIGIVFGQPDWIRLSSVSDCQIGPARLAPD